MRRVVPPGAVALCVAALVACSTSPTQLVVVVDTDLQPGRDLDEVTVTVTGPSGTAEVERASMAAEADAAHLPLTLGVAPHGDALGPVTVIAAALRDGSPVLTREHRVTLVRGETRVLTLHLARSCLGRAACRAGETCGEAGCVAVDVEGDALPRWQGQAPRLDEFGGMADAGPRTCGGPSDCDDDDPCTTDACEGGACVYAPADGACDDGVFCNGLDRCEDGRCAAHDGPPCVGATTCDESSDRCTGCSGDADCPAPTEGAWSACAFATDCEESGTQTRTARTFACVDGACEPTDREESQACTRTTAGTRCAAPTCADWSACAGFDATCDETGTRSRACSVGECAGGACTARAITETEDCTRDTDSAGCGDPQCGAWSGCGDFPDTCDTSGTETRTCRPALCADGACGLGAEYVESRACARTTDGTPCGARECPPTWGACTGTGCATSGTQTRTCDDRVCGGGVCGRVPAVESQACARVTEGNPCNDGRFCTSGDTCSGGVCRSGSDDCPGSCTCTVTGCRAPPGSTIICDL
ncbi:hypothetical protein [Sandaracinus amylolyticus]|uniref:hypothetical protein n=1 Tax=Sandaracinus amylolyticus TaxID=927083 RepID=UPI001F3AB5C8|nr:hypothetical protein [Sandaracinus amylolyticus]UJR79907.1 Hypothetical protein I5071_19470 [Sandaracinus amylolyticus]